MKHNIQLLALVIAAVFSSTAFSDSKPVTRIDFNNLIDANNQKKIELQNESAPVANVQAPKKDDKGKVIDFIDVEIGVGQTPTLTDRRFDSVDAPKVVDLKNIGL